MGDSSDPSFFASVRAVVCFICADGKIHERESEWYLTLLNGYGLSSRERSQLRKDFENPPDLEELFKQIKRPEDRDRLMRWARNVVSVDAEESSPEAAMVRKLVTLNANAEKDLSESASALAAFVRDEQKELRFWREIGEAGAHFSARAKTTLFHGTTPGPGHLIVKGFASGNRVIIGATFLLVALAALAYWGMIS